MKFTIVVPTYNEAENIENLIEKLIRLNLGAKIIIVDDNSPDKTAEVVDNLAHSYSKVSLISRNRKSGYGSAHIEGFKWALNKGAEIIISMDMAFQKESIILRF